MSGPIRNILIVDDDPQILKLVQKMLGGHDFHIQLAPKPSDALRICETEPLHLLISDIAMPEMDGNKLTEKVLKLHPGASVLLISGHYKEEPAAARSGRVQFLKKPFFPSELLEKLREMLPDL
ncbi:MAG TPA: response regulator [Bryobacteraceae bacterium]|nr:response regulator [Bryobacteraceae bacterium]